VAPLRGHAAVGCLSAVASGGQCGPGALSAGVGSAAAPLVGGIANGSPLIGAGLSGAIGGFASVAGGGKFADGAVTAAFGYLFNQLAHQGPVSAFRSGNDTVYVCTQMVVKRSIAVERSPGETIIPAM
jgi:hypothetical protein